MIICAGLHQTRGQKVFGATIRWINRRGTFGAHHALLKELSYEDQLSANGIYSLALKKWGLYWICPACPSVILLFRHNSVFFFKILRMNRQNLTKFCIHSIIDKIYVGIVNRHFLQICNNVMVWPLIDVRISFSLNILRMNGQNLTTMCIHISIDKI